MAGRIICRIAAGDWRARSRENKPLRLKCDGVVAAGRHNSAAGIALWGCVGRKGGAALLFRGYAVPGIWKSTTSDRSSRRTLRATERNFVGMFAAGWPIDKQDYDCFGLAGAPNPLRMEKLGSCENSRN